MSSVKIISNETILSHSQKYNVILADPPWSYSNTNGGINYSQMTMSELSQLKVSELANKDCALFMWATFALLPEQIKVLESWGFTYKTGFAWHKLTKNGKDYFGNGFWLRSSAELLLLGIKGKPKLLNRSTRNIITAPALGHSIKPKIQYDIIESMFEGPYLELFARNLKEGWDSWGNEI